MDSFEIFFKIAAGLFGLVLTMFKIIDLSNKSVNKIQTELNILEKTKMLGVKNEHLKEHIEKLIEEKYPKLNEHRKRNWFIIIISFLLFCGLYYFIYRQINSKGFEFSALSIFEFLALALFLAVFWTALINRQD